MLRHFKGVFRTLRLWSRVWWWCRSEHLGSSPTSPPLSSSSGRALSALFTGAIWWMIVNLGIQKSQKIYIELSGSVEKNTSHALSFHERREEKILVIQNPFFQFPFWCNEQPSLILLWGPFWFVGSFLGLDLTKTCTPPLHTHTQPPLNLLKLVFQVVTVACIDGHCACGKEWADNFIIVTDIISLSESTATYCIFIFARSDN